MICIGPHSSSNSLQFRIVPVANEEESNPSQKMQAYTASNKIFLSTSASFRQLKAPTVSPLYHTFSTSPVSNNCKHNGCRYGDKQVSIVMGMNIVYHGTDYNSGKLHHVRYQHHRKHCRTLWQLVKPQRLLVLGWHIRRWCVSGIWDRAGFDVGNGVSVNFPQLLLLQTQGSTTTMSLTALKNWNGILRTKKILPKRPQRETNERK